MGTQIKALSEYEYDEFGTYAEFETQCGGHDHKFAPLSSTRALVFFSKSGIDVSKLANDFEPRCGQLF